MEGEKNRTHLIFLQNQKQIIWFRKAFVIVSNMMSPWTVYSWWMYFTIAPFFPVSFHSFCKSLQIHRAFYFHFSRVKSHNKKVPLCVTFKYFFNFSKNQIKYQFYGRHTLRFVFSVIVIISFISFCLILTLFLC